MKIILLLILSTLVSCANFVNSIHRQLDNNEKTVKRQEKTKRDPYYAYREKEKWRTDDDRRPIKNPVTYSLSDGGPSGRVNPPVKREYRPQRYKANDFVDNDEDGSLWANQGSNASLFTYHNDKHTGDMVIINVLENLRNQISSELKRTFPDKPRKAKDDGKKSDAPAAAAAAPANPADNDIDMKVYDKISGTVTEELNKDYIVVSGRKEVIFKKEKRSIEVQALVSRKDIMENDYVNSDKLHESRVYILRDN